MVRMRRVACLLLTLVMVIGMLPMYALRADAAGTVLDAAIFCSDVHGNSSSVSSAFNGIKNADPTFNPSTATFVGDTQMAASTVTSAAQSVYSDVACYYAYGNHDSEGNYGISDVTGLLYSGDNYYIYAISQTSMASSNPDTSVFTSTVAGLDKTKPLFIASHLPLHDRRGDSNGAAKWYEAISAAAEEMDIVFFWAHNHTGEDAVDRAAFYVAKDGDETITLENTSTKVTPNFTYMNAGFVGKSSSRGGVVSTVKIYADTLVFQDYNSSGAFTDEYSHNVTVAREFASSGSTDTTDPTDPTEDVTDPTEGETTAPSTPSEGETDGNVTDYGTYNEVTLGGTLTTTEPKTVYILSSGNPSGNVLIASRNSEGDVNLVANDGGDLSNVESTVIYGDCDGDGDSEYYIELTDAEATNSVWAVTSGYKFANQGEYLRYSSGLSVSSNSTNWSYSSNRLSYRSSRTTYYLRYNNGWTTTSSSTSASSIYFYVPTEVEVETTVDTTVKYTMRADDLKKVVTDTNKTGTIDYCLQGNGTDLTTLPSGGSYSFTVTEGDAKNPIIASIGNDGTVTFTGATGTAEVKVAYTWTQDGETYTVYKNITVEAAEPYYTVDITSGDAVVTGTTITEKGVTNGQTLQLGTEIRVFDGTDDEGTIYTLTDADSVSWHIPEEYQTIATVNHDTGVVTFKGVDGAFYVTATLTVNGKNYTAGVNISATTNQYSVPSDGATDFPEYPNEGAIRYDKTATAVGNFSETGIAQVELSMTGVPYTTGSEIDVVLMLDMTGSMDDVTSSTSEPTGYVRVDATIAASKAFIKTIVKNEDGSYNGNRVGVYVFNKNGAATLFDFGTVDSDTELNAIYADLESIYDDHYASGGTPYDDGLSKCYDVLAAAKTDGTGNNRQQFTVFMTDGVPTSYAYVNGTTYGTHSSASDIAGMLTSSDNYATRDTDYKYEYYSTQMKKAGVTVYSVGVGLENTNNAWSGTATQCLNLASALLNDISGPGGETTQPDAVGTSTHSKKDKYFFSVEDATAGTDMEKVFSNIAMEILQAATDITVEDQITDEYTMIFDIPTGDRKIEGVTNDFYIEFLKYTLDEDHERTDEVTSVTKLYLKNTNGVYSAASDSAGTAYNAPVFENKVIGEKGSLYYWTTDISYAPKEPVTYTASGTTYYFVPYGIKATDSGYDSTKWFNMTSGGYANGTVDSETNMSEDLVIATPYFVYNAATKMLYWTVDKLDTAEYALRYFLYLDNSATEVGVTGVEVDAGTYPTNDHAYITYTNFLGHDCQQKFPIPQLTWNGAQVSYVFYLVNAAGQPINKSGQVVDFANATFVTDVYTTAVVWNKGEDGQVDGSSNLSVDWLANNLLPDDYLLYDLKAGYELKVYAEADGTSIFDYFTIDGDTAANISTSLNERLNLNTTTASVTTTKVYNTKAGQKVTGYGTYTSEATDLYNGEIVLNEFDFYNTTVAFAVVWQPRLVPDVVVVDYGLDVLINVVQNDILQNTISGLGVGNSAYGNIAMNTGVSTKPILTATSLTLEDGNTISIENENQIRFSQSDMVFTEPVAFYYESPVEFWEGSNPTEGFMYSSVTVIPATTIYYEDEYVTLNTFTQKVEYSEVKYTAESDTEETYYTKTDDGYVAVEEPVEGEIYYVAVESYVKNKGWDTNSENATAIQDQDRPGESQISADIDADNNYGYDSAYGEQSTYSMGNAAKVNVKSGKYATAEFEFWGTGFDIISMTDKTTGVIVVDVYDANGDKVLSETVNNYYGYAREYYDVTYTYTNGEWVPTNEVKRETAGTVNKAPENPSEGDYYTTCEFKWVTTNSNDPNAIYQVPVLKIGDGKTTEVLPYGKYKAVITATYVKILDKTAAPDGYDFYLDAIRIYNPTGNGNEIANDAYVADGEGWPEYFEVRDQLISQEAFSSITDVSVNGMVFIDGALTTGAGDAASVQDYISYGPNNEVYLECGNAIAFDLNATAKAGSVAKIQLAIKTVGGNGEVEVYGLESGNKIAGVSETIKTATDMYYDITNLNGKTVVIKNSGDSNDAIISITNVKITYTEAQTSDNTAPASEGQDTEVYSPFTVSRATASIALMSMAPETEEDVPEDTKPSEPTEPETTEPETEPSEPETTEPETEPSEPETTEPETEPTEPETTEPTYPDNGGTVSRFIKVIKKLLGWLWG